MDNCDNIICGWKFVDGMKRDSSLLTIQILNLPSGKVLLYGDETDEAKALIKEAEDYKNKLHSNDTSYKCGNLEVKIETKELNESTENDTVSVCLIDSILSDCIMLDSEVGIKETCKRKECSNEIRKVLDEYENMLRASLESVDEIRKCL